MSTGILFIEPEIISGCEDDRDTPSPWDELSEEEVILVAKSLWKDQLDILQ